jgi:hypothetical protein
MTNDDLWKLINLIDKDALNDGDEDQALEQLQENINQLDDNAIFEFDNLLSKALYDLDGKIFSNESGESGGSDDAFLYARCWVVAQGKDHYLKTLNDPKLMPKSLDQWCESLLYLGQNAWAQNNDSDPSEYPHIAEPSYESGSNEKNW